MTLGQRIKMYRQEMGLSQEALAEKVNVSRQAITKWENDNGLPDIDNLISLSRVMGISLDELVMGEKECDISDMKKEVVQQRNRTGRLYLISVLCFLTASVCWVIFVIGCIANGNDTAAVLGWVNILMLIFPITVFGKKYLETKSR